MVSYILEGWKKELDQHLDYIWAGMIGTKFDEQMVARSIHHKMIVFMDELIRDDKMVDSFRPFAIAYIEKSYMAKIKMFKTYNGIG